MGSNLSRRLASAPLKPCQPRGSDLKIEVVGRIRYPDAFVVCPQMLPDVKIVTDPVVISEILSDSSDRRDRIVKNEEYGLTPRVRRYVILEQDQRAATVWAREGERWVGTLLKGDTILSMPEIDIEIRLAEFYEGLTLSEDQQPAT